MYFLRYSIYPWLKSYQNNSQKATILLKTVSATYIACKLYALIYNHDKHLSDRIHKWFFKTVRSLPVIGTKIQEEVNKAKADVAAQKSLYNPSYLMQLPENSSTADQMIERVEAYLNVLT